MTISINIIDSLTNQETAFCTFAALAERCAGGWTPSLKATNYAQRRIGQALEMRGYSVFWK